MHKNWAYTVSLILIHVSTKAVLNVFYNKLGANLRLFYYKHQKRKCAADMKFCDVMDSPGPPAADIKRPSSNIMSNDMRNI